MDKKVDIVRLLGGTLSIKKWIMVLYMFTGVFSRLVLAIIRVRVWSGMENARARVAKIGPQITKKQTVSGFLRYYRD